MDCPVFSFPGSRQGKYHHIREISSDLHVAEAFPQQGKSNLWVAYTCVVYCDPDTDDDRELMREMGGVVGIEVGMVREGRSPNRAE